MRLTAEQLERLETIATAYKYQRFRYAEFGCFTDGHVMVAVKCDDPIEGKVPESVEALLSGDPQPVGMATASDLRAWCAFPACDVCRNSRTVPCAKCKGTATQRCSCDCGGLSHEIECEWCNKGKVQCECMGRKMYGVIAGYPVNRGLFGPALDAWPFDGEYRIGLLATHYKTTDSKVIIFHAEDHSIFLMPLRRSSMSDEEIAHAKENAFDVLAEVK